MSFFANLLRPMRIRCPMCGMETVKSRIVKPMGPFVKDGPTVMKMTCTKCGHTWRVPLRVGP